MAARPCALERAAPLVSRATGTVGGIPQEIYSGTDPHGSRGGPAPALCARPPQEAPDLAVRFEKGKAEQRDRAQGITRRHAKASHRNRPRRGALHAPAGSGSAPPQIGLTLWDASFKISAG